jgi:hypothetical protein
MRVFFGTRDFFAKDFFACFFVVFRFFVNFPLVFHPKTSYFCCASKRGEIHRRKFYLKFVIFS